MPPATRASEPVDGIPMSLPRLRPKPEDPTDPALEPETLGIDDTDTALATEDASNPAE